MFFISLNKTQFLLLFILFLSSNIIFELCNGFCGIGEGENLSIKFNSFDLSDFFERSFIFDLFISFDELIFIPEFLNLSFLLLLLFCSPFEDFFISVLLFILFIKFNYFLMINYKNFIPC